MVLLTFDIGKGFAGRKQAKKRYKEPRLILVALEATSP